MVFTTYVEEMIEYHRAALTAFEQAFPHIRNEIGRSKFVLHPAASFTCQPVFGVDLKHHLRKTGRSVSVVIEKCVDLIRSSGYEEKGTSSVPSRLSNAFFLWEDAAVAGLFRISGNANKIRRLKAAFDAWQVDDDSDTFARDPHSVCSVLKSYLRELPDSLLCDDLHANWQTAVRYKETPQT